MDVAVLAQNGVHNAVATLGTAVTIEHLNKIFRYTSEIIFCLICNSKSANISFT